MKRGVPPTARKARTGELTPPGITRCARAKSSSLVDTARHSCLGLIAFRRRLAFFAFDGLAFFGRRQRPEEAVRHDVAHARAEACVEAVVEESQGLADGGLQVAARRQQRNE